MSRFQIAQLNIGVAKGTMDHPVMAEFVANLDRINTLADNSPGFVWRLQTESGNATDISPFDDNTIVNMSVWEDIPSLNHYVYKTVHVDIMKRRKEWFERMKEMHMVLWWVPQGHQPTVQEALSRLDHLRAHGPSERAFSFKNAFPAPDAMPSAPPPFFGDACPAL